MTSKFAAAAILAGLALAPSAADAAWWNPFQRDKPPTEGNAQNTPVPPLPLNTNTGGAGGGGVGTVTTTTIAPPVGGGGAASLPPPGGGALAVSSTGAPPIAANDVTLRLDRMEAQMRNLNGQIEQLTFQLRQAQDQLRALREEGGAPAADAGTAAKRRSDARTTTTNTEVVSLGHPVGVNLKEVPMDGGEAVGDDAIGGKIAPVRRGDPPRVLGTVPAAGGSAGATIATTGNAAGVGAGAAGAGPLSIATLASGGQAGAASGTTGAGGNTVASLSPMVPAEDPRIAYDRAYQNILSGDYEVAERGLRNFIASYPNDRLAGDAQYWLGESFYARSMYKEAAAAFLSGYRTYPKSNKAAETLLKLGLSLKGLGQREEACNTFAEVVKRYPKSSNAMMQRVKTEQAGANCG